MGELSMKERCVSIQERFLDLMDGQITPREREELEAHIGTCQECGRHWREYEMAVASLRSLGELQVPPAVLEGIRRRLQGRGLIHRLRDWIVVSPWRVPRPALAALAVLMMTLGLWRMEPWKSSKAPEGPEMASRTVPVESRQVSLGGPAVQWGLPGQIEGVSLGLDLESEWPIKGRALIRDDMVLEVTATEEVFQRIEGILSESKGRMFLIGLRHLNSGEILRSRILLEVPLASYERVANQIEALGPVSRVFMERESVPTRPDRLRITLVATDALDHLRGSEIVTAKPE